MAETVETIQININATTDQATKKIGRVVSALQKVKEAYTGIQTGKLNFYVDAQDTESIDNAAKALASLKKSFEGIVTNKNNFAQMFNIPAQTVTNLQNLTERIATFKETLNGFSFKFNVNVPKDAGREVEQIADVMSRGKNALEPFESKIHISVTTPKPETMENLRHAASVMNTIQKDYPDLDGFNFDLDINANVHVPRADVSDNLLEIARTVHEIQQQYPDVNGFSLQIDANVGHIGKSVENTNHRLAKSHSWVSRIADKVKHIAWSAAKGGLKGLFSAPLAPAKALMGTFKEVSKTVGTFFASLKRIAMYRLFRSMIRALTDGMKTGIENLYHYSEYAGTEFFKSMNKIATAALYMKNTLATIAEPIINAIAPAIDLLSDKFAVLAEKVASFLAQLFGQSTYSKAIKIPKSMYEESQKATKELQKWLGPFDEINRLNAPSGSGSGEETDWSKMFETITLTDEGVVSKFIKKLKDGIKKADLTSIGKALAKKLQDALKSINWENIKKVARNVGKSIGTFIMGFFTNTDENGESFTQTLGRTIANGLNTAVQFGLSLLESIQFDVLGQKLGDGLKQFLQDFDWQGAFTAATGFVQGFIDFLTNAIDSVGQGSLLSTEPIIEDKGPGSKWREIDPGAPTNLHMTGWEQFGKKIGDSLANVPWTKIFGGMLNLGKTIMTALFDVIIGFGETGQLNKMFEEVGKQIGAILGDVKFWKKCFKAIGTIGGAFVDGLVAAINEAIKGLTGTDLGLDVDQGTGESIFSGFAVTLLMSKLFGGSGKNGKGGFNLSSLLLLIPLLSSLGGTESGTTDTSKVDTTEGKSTGASKTQGLSETALTTWAATKMPGGPIAKTLTWLTTTLSGDSRQTATPEEEKAAADMKKTSEDLREFWNTLSPEEKSHFEKYDTDIWGNRHKSYDYKQSDLQAYKELVDKYGPDPNHWKESGVYGSGDSTATYASWKEGLTELQKQKLQQVMDDWGTTHMGATAYGELTPQDLAFQAYSGGVDFDSWYKDYTGKSVLPTDWDPYRADLHNVDAALDELDATTKKFTQSTETAGENMSTAADYAGDLSKGIRKISKPMDGVRGQFANSARGIVASMDGIDGAVDHTKRRMGQRNPLGENKFADASDTIIGSAVVSANAISDVRGSVDNLYARNARQNALGQEEYGVAANTIKSWAEADKAGINNTALAVDTLSTRNKKKNPLGEDEFGAAARKLMGYADEGKQHIEGIEDAADTVKERFKGKNPLGHEGFDTETGHIKGSAKAAADEILGIGTSADSAATDLSGGMSDMESDVTGFKTKSMSELNAFSQGMTRGMGQTMSDFVDAGNHGLDTMLKNYKKFSEETARLMSNTAATYTQTTFYRYSGEGAPTPTIKPFSYDTMMADGGFLEQGEAFIARESGPELVGRIGHRSAVVNNDQIVASVSAGVSDANADVVNAIYAGINQVVSTIRENRASNGTVNWDAVARQITRAQRRQAAAVGT